MAEKTSRATQGQRCAIKAVHIFIAICLVALAIFLVPSCILAVLHPKEPHLQIVVQTVMEFVSAVVLIWAISKGNWKEWGFCAPTKIPKAVYAGLLIGVVSVLLGMLISTVIEFKPISYLEIPFLYQIPCFWLLAPVGEETVFRGLAQSYLRVHIKGSFRLAKWRVSYPALIGALVFGLVHLGSIGQGANLPATIFTVCTAFVVGLVAGYFRDETGSLGAPILIHSLVNVVGILFTLF